MRIPPAMAADLALLTQALDLDDVDVASTVALMSTDVAAAVSSYVGLTVRVGSAGNLAELTTLGDAAETARIVTSLRLPLSGGTRTSGPPVLIVLYAAALGAFVDMAADLAWLTGRDLGEIGLDLDLGEGHPARPATSLRSRSTIDQAIGVLLARGRTAEQATAELDMLALGAGSDRLAAAVELLAVLPGRGADVTYDAD